MTQTPDDETPMTAEELLDLIEKLGVKAKYHCTQGRNKGMMAVRLEEPYLEPDTLARLQKNLFARRQEKEPGPRLV
jgi:hypothetical protein